MINGKQRSYLKGLAQKENVIIHLGKASLTPEVTQNIEEALAARELVKIGILKNCDDDPNEVADTVAARTHSDVVQVIGRKIVLYRPAKEPKIVLPKITKKTRTEG